MQNAELSCQRKQDTFRRTSSAVTAAEEADVSVCVCARAVILLLAGPARVIALVHVNQVVVSLFITVTSSLAHGRSCRRHAGVCLG